MQSEKLWTVEEVRKRLDLPSINSVRVMCSRRQIPFIRLGRRVRFVPRDIELWLQENRVETLYSMFKF